MKIISRESRTVHATLVFSYREGRASSGGGSKEGEKGDGRDLHVERELVGGRRGEESKASNDRGGFLRTTKK